MVEGGLGEGKEMKVGRVDGWGTVGWDVRDVRDVGWFGWFEGDGVGGGRGCGLCEGDHELCER